jgi:hypothetical protein
VKIVVRVLGVSLALSIAAAFLAPDGWMWPTIGTILFIGIFIVMRVGSAEIGRALEKKFNGE